MTTIAITVRQLTRADANGIPRRVTVAPFENLTGQDSMAWIGVMLADMLIHNLTRDGLVNVTPLPSMLSAIRAQSGFQPKALGEETGASIIVHGSYLVRADSLVIQPQIIDATGDSGLAAPAPVVGPARDQVAIMRTVFDRVMVGLSILLDPGRRWSIQLPIVPTSMQAYRAYIAGFERFIALDYSQALEHFERAVQLDPTFTTAQLALAMTWSNASGDVPKTDSILSIVQLHRDDLLPYERATLDWLQAWVDGNLHGVLEAARDIANIRGGPHLGGEAVQAALWLNRLDEAYRRIARMLEPRRHRTSAWLWEQFGLVLHARGEHQRELREIQTGLGLINDKRFLLPREILALAALGETDTLRARLELAKSSGFLSGNNRDIFRKAASELRAHGHAEAETFGRLAAQWYRE
ncbi:MAG: hypothetical protein ACREMA_15720, partial [Longimicrobiales bacterium]